MFLYVCVFVEVLFEYNFQACDMGVGTGDCNIVVTIYMERFGTRMGDPKYLVLLLSITLLVWYTNIYHVRQFTRAILFLYRIDERNCMDGHDMTMTDGTRRGMEEEQRVRYRFVLRLSHAHPARPQLYSGLSRFYSRWCCLIRVRHRR